MNRTVIVSSVLLGALLSTQSSAGAANGSIGAPADVPRATQVALHHSPKKKLSPARRSGSGAVTYNRDSPNPNIGWHWQGGMRVCTQDCDNPEIPGSGFTCRNVRLFGMNWRECNSTN